MPTRSKSSPEIYDTPTFLSYDTIIVYTTARVNRRILYDTKRARTVAAGRRQAAAARWHNPTPPVRVVPRLHYSSFCAFSGCRAVAMQPKQQVVRAT